MTYHDCEVVMWLSCDHKIKVPHLSAKDAERREWHFIFLEVGEDLSQHSLGHHGGECIHKERLVLLRHWPLSFHPKRQVHILVHLNDCLGDVHRCESVQVAQEPHHIVVIQLGGQWGEEEGQQVLKVECHVSPTELVRVVLKNAYK